MTNKSDKLVEAVAKLLALTQEGRLVWETGQSASLDAGAFVASHKGQRLRIRKVPAGPQRYYNQPEEDTVLLEFVDEFGNQAWAFPDIEGLSDLYEAAAYQASGVKDFLRDLLDG